MNLIGGLTAAMPRRDGQHHDMVLPCGSFRRVCSPLPYGVFSYFEVLPDSATAVSKDMVSKCFKLSLGLRS